MYALELECGKSLSYSFPLLVPPCMHIVRTRSADMCGISFAQIKYKYACVQCSYGAIVEQGFHRHYRIAPRETSVFFCPNPERDKKNE